MGESLLPVSQANRWPRFRTDEALEQPAVTLDAFLDDSMFMYCRWLSAGNRAEIAVWPGADHAFTDMPHPLAAPANARIDRFLATCLE